MKFWIILLASFVVFNLSSAAQNDAPQSPTKVGLKDQISLSEDLVPPPGPLFEYSNSNGEDDAPAQPIPSEAYNKPEGEDMETAGTFIIGPHSGRFFGSGSGSGLWLGVPNFYNSYRPYRPRPVYHYPHRYHYHRRYNRYN